MELASVLEVTNKETTQVQVHTVVRRPLELQEA